MTTPTATSIITAASIRHQQKQSNDYHTNNSSNDRDIVKQRIDIIQRQMADLRELGVQSGFCYISMSTLYSVGDPCITQCIENSRNTILTRLSSSSNSLATETSPLATGSRDTLTTPSNDKMFHFPTLRKPIDELCLNELRTLIINIIHELGYRWSDNRPSFWPKTVPYQCPSNIPDKYQDCWTEGLKLVLKSIYNHYTSVGGVTEQEMGGVSEDEEEEVDVCTPPEDTVGVVNVLDSDDISDNEEEAESDRPPLSYFGYELARSESSHASSPNHTHESSEEYKGPLSLITQPVIYCPPSLYSQIYPSLSLPTNTPLLLPLMKQLYVPPTTTRSESPPTLSPIHNEERHVTPPIETHPLPPVKIPDTKNKKSKNGIYIYTNPTAPLQFMSLNKKSTNHTSSCTPSNHTPSQNTYTSLNHTPSRSKTHAITNHTPQRTSDTPTNRQHKYKDHKLISPVSPHTGEPIRDHAPQLTTPTINNEIDGEKSSRSKINTHIKKKRELVFHWYKSPDINPPNTKRHKLLDTV